MIPLRSLGLKLPSYLTNWATDRSSPSVDIPAVPVHDIAKLSEDNDKSTREKAGSLERLLRLNHINHSIIYNHLRFHNHCSHILGSAYALGAEKAHLQKAYDYEASSLEKWTDSPGEISMEDWRDYLGQREYQRAYIDFFEDRLAEEGYDWKTMVSRFLFDGKEPLANGLLSSLAHCVIHLGYAFEFNNKQVATEALAMTTCCRDDLHRFLDDPSYTKPSQSPTTDLLSILAKVAKDDRLNGAASDEAVEDVSHLFVQKEHEAAVLEAWNSWDLTNPTEQFKESQRVAAAVLVASPSKKHPQYDFILCHVLTSSHAVRILLPLFPVKWHMSLVRQWWLFTLTAYILQMRPVIDLKRITEYDLKGRDWSYVVDRALNSPGAMDAHYVKACRALKVAAETWGDADQFYLKAAVRFAEEFDDWSFVSR